MSMRLQVVRDRARLTCDPDHRFNSTPSQPERSKLSVRRRSGSVRIMMPGEQVGAVLTRTDRSVPRSHLGSSRTISGAPNALERWPP